MDEPTYTSYLHSNATGLKEKLALGRAVVLGRAHVPAGRDALQVSRSIALSQKSAPDHRLCSVLRLDIAMM